MAKAKKKTVVKKKRKASPAQLAALAKGRAKIAKKRKPSNSKKPSTRRKTRSTGTSVVVIQPSQEKKVMAKKKSSGNSSSAPRKKTSPARRGLSGIKGKAKGMIPVVKDVALAVAGGVAAGAIANKLPIADNRLKAAAPVVAGILLAGVMGKKNAMFREVGTGMAVIGAIGLIKQLMPNVPVLAGEDQVYIIPDNAGYAGDMMQLGYDDQEFMGEMTQLGNEEYLSPASM